MATKYRYRGYLVYSCGYHQPDHCVWWEAVDEKTNEACFHGTTKREVISLIDESIVEDQWKAKLAKAEEKICNAKLLLKNCKHWIKTHDIYGHIGNELIADIEKFMNS